MLAMICRLLHFPKQHLLLLQKLFGVALQTGLFRLDGTQLGHVLDAQQDKGMVIA